jgi:hypothetical protein
MMPLLCCNPLVPVPSHEVKVPEQTLLALLTIPNAVTTNTVVEMIMGAMLS